jgi:hypothetical protein
LFKFLPRVRFVPGWFPRFRVYKFFDEWIVEAKPVVITKHIWRAIRMQGGGSAVSPYEMEYWEALIWISEQVRGEIVFVDREVGFIFYR